MILATHVSCLDTVCINLHRVNIHRRYRPQEVSSRKPEDEQEITALRKCHGLKQKTTLSAINMKVRFPLVIFFL